jgi:hypothetical protein
VGPGATNLHLLVHLDRPSYFLDEPVYIVYELVNTGLDTAWVRPFSLETQDLYGSLRVGSVAVPYGGVTASLAYPARGFPLAPGASFFEPALVQDHWGKPTPQIGELYFSRQLPIGTYVFQADFRWDPANGGSVITSGPLTFEVRQRNSFEDSLAQTVRLLANLPFDSVTRPEFVPALIAYVSVHAASSSKDPFLAYLCTYQPEVAAGAGLGLTSSAVDTLVDGASVVALGAPTTSAATVAVFGIDHLRPGLLPSLASQLGSSALSGRLAASLVSHGQWWQELKQGSPP